MMLSGDEFYDDEVTSGLGPVFRVTAIRPSAQWMPEIAAYMALAEAMHEGSDLCNANYYRPFAECDVREADIGDAVALLVELHKAGWVLQRDPGDTIAMGL